MFTIRNNLQYFLFFYILICLSIWYAKPSIMFTSDGKMRHFGTGRELSIFSYPVAIIYIAIIGFYIFEIYMLKLTNLF